MGWFTKSKDKVLAKTRRVWFDRQPSPSNLTKLVQSLLSLADYREAFRMTSIGVKRFPKDELILELHRIAATQKARQGVDEAREEMIANPSLRNYLRLARDLMTLRDTEAARTTLEECTERYSDCAPAFALLAQIYERVYLRDLAPEDGLKVVRAARRAARLHAEDPEPLYRLARFFDRIGAQRHALDAVKAALGRDPGHPGARELGRDLRTRPPYDEGEITAWFERIEDEGKLPTEDGEREGIQAELGRLRDNLPDLLAALPGSRCTIVGPDGDAYEELGVVPHDVFITMAQGLLSSTQLTSRKIGLGPIRAITLETGGGSVVLRRGSRASVVCKLPRDGKLKGSQMALKRMMQAGTPLAVEAASV